jgi:hypothetical protein
MNGCVRIVALVLVLAGMTSALAAQLCSAQGPHEEPGGCHQHGNKLPERVPVDYKCCVAGHGSAIVRPSSASQPALQGTLVLPFATPLPTEPQVGLIPSQIAPPATTTSFVPLRV